MIYLDNAATTWPKPESVALEMVECINKKGANPGRGGHKMALEAGRVIYQAREAVADLFNINNPIQVLFASNATEAINIGLMGFAKQGDHIITSSMEHNSVSRPLQLLRDKGIEVSVAMCNKEGFLNPQDVAGMIKDNTKLIVLTHASNVSGTIMPIKEIGDIAKQKNIAFMVDAAQSAGFLEIDVEAMNIDMLAFPGHKGLYGPQGTGGLYLREGLNLQPFKVGGTGSNSESLYQPEILPDKFESGTPNTVGIAGLAAGIRYIKELGLEYIREKEYFLMKRLLEGMKNINGLITYGPGNCKHQVPVISFNFGQQDSSEIAYILDQVFNIATRAGLHCSPEAHKTMGTFEQGTVRISLSSFNNEKDIDDTLTALNKISQEI